MPQKRAPSSASRASAPQRRPVQDIKAAKAASQFPAVGMTLHSYQYDSRDRSRRKPGQSTVVKGGRWRRLWHDWTLKKAVVTLAIVVLLLGGFVSGKFLWNLHKVFGGNILGIFHSTKLKGEDVGRVNILLAGNSADDAGHNGGQLTDSIMLISIDTKQNKGFLLSIPRDLWVDVGDDGHQKINRAYVSGQENDFDQSGYPKGGMGQLEQVVSEDFGIDINYYALVNYSALKQAVDAVGGVDFTVKSADPRGIYDPSLDYTTRYCCALAKYPNGKVHLNGKQALNLSRARGDAYGSYGFPASDFDRTENQRQLLIALKSRAVSAGTIANPAKLTSLFDAIGGNVQTDFKIDEVRRLYDLSKKINGNNVQSLSLNKGDNGKSLLASYAAPGGQSALIPAAGVDDYSDIQSFLKRKISSSAVVQEAASIVVLNGTTVDGLATKKKTFLANQDFLVSGIGDAGNIAQSTTAIINTSGSGKPATSAALVKLFGNHLTTQNPYAGMYLDADFIIVLGKDQATSNTQAAH